MLLSFSIENYRSFQAEQTLNLLASRRGGTPEGDAHCCEIPGIGEHALRVASLYGANGAGKSNLVRALALVKRLVTHGTAPGQPISHTPFLLDAESSAKPSVFELQFLEDGEVFRYGFCYDASRVHEEWLDVYEGKKERNLFARTTQENGAVTVELGPAAQGPNTSHKMKSLADVGARPNQLFLTEVMNLDDPEAQGPRFRRAVTWFKSTVSIIEPDARFLPLAQMIAADEQFAHFAERFLRDASTGISRLEVKTDDMAKIDLPELFQQLFKAVLEGSSGENAGILPLSAGEEVVLEGTGKEKVRRRRIVAWHDQGTALPTPLPLQEESDGSRRLLNLLPALYRLAGQGGVFVIDELERSMHPMLARKFVEFFLKGVPNAKGQLIFATHESTLLDLDLVRRDGIWFAEKDEKGATHLYSLADFKVRKDLRIEKGYLEGRFGAIPFLGGIDHLMEEQAAAETDA
jgi:predicted ATPase